MVDPISITLFVIGVVAKKMLIKGSLVAAKTLVVGAKTGVLKSGAVYAADHAAAIHAFSIAHATALKSLAIGVGCIAGGALTMEILEKLAAIQAAGGMTLEKALEIGRQVEQMTDKQMMKLNDKMDDIMKDILEEG